jgi:multicomponent Na+:H+ antiporter subunit D
MHSKSKESKQAALKYLFYSLGGGFLGLIAIVTGIYYSYGAGEFIIGGTVPNTLSPELMIFAQISLLCGLIGFGAKAGVFPLQAWLPTAHPVAPSPASALLSGLITKAGVIVIIRLVFYVYGQQFMAGTFVQYVWEGLLLITILLGSTLALLQNTFKRRLAYSSISQLSYVLLGVCSLQEVGFNGSMLHVLSHAMIKVGLFLVAGYLIYQYDIHHVSEMEGIGKKSPIAMWCYTLFSLALVGVPPTGAFFSKWYLAIGSLNSNLSVFEYLGVIVLLTSAILTAVYLLSITIKAFFPTKKEEVKKDKEPVLMVLPLIILVIGVFAVGIFSTHITDIISMIWRGL